MSYGLRNGSHCCFEGYVCDLGKVAKLYWHFIEVWRDDVIFRKMQMEARKVGNSGLCLSNPKCLCFTGIIGK